MVGISGAVNLNAGVYVTLPQNAFLEINLLTQEISKANLDGLLAQAIPIGIGADVDLSTALQLDLSLRLRSEVGLAAGLDILGLDIGAGADVAVWISLFDYATTMSSTSACPISAEESFQLNAGVAVDVNVDLASTLDLTLAPSVVVSLASAKGATACLTSGSYSGAFGRGGTLDRNQTAANASGDRNTGALADQEALNQNNGASLNASSSSIGVSSGTQAPVGSSTAVQRLQTAAAIGAQKSASSNDNGLATSTVTTTATYTITSCAASIPNCPKSHTQKVITSTVIVKTTICPATISASTTLAYGRTSTAPVSSGYSRPTSSNSTLTQSFPTPTVGTTVTVSVCPKPTTTTYTPPSNCPTPPPTVIIDDTTTICPATETTSAGPTALPASTTIPPKTTVSAQPTGAAPAGTGTWTPPTSPTGAPTTPVTAGAPKWRLSEYVAALAIMAMLL